MDTIQTIPPSLAFDLVIFDCDGVLVDSEVISCGVVADMLTRHGVPTELDDALRSFLGRPASVVTDALTQQTKKPVPDTFVSSWREYLFARFEQELVAVEGIRSAIEAIPLPRCVASSSDEERLQISLGQTDLLALFGSNIFSTTMVKNGKPAPDLFLFAARQMGVSASRCVVVEDSPSGVKAAKAAGMTAIGFTGGSHFLVVDNTETLRNAGADYILKDATDLPSLLREISDHDR